MPRQPITDLTEYADKPATENQERFAEWILEVTGKEFSTQKEIAAFKEGVRLAKVLVMKFQAAHAGNRKSAVTSESETEKPAARSKKSSKTNGNGKTRRKKAAAVQADDDEVTDAPF